MGQLCAHWAGDKEGLAGLPLSLLGGQAPFDPLRAVLQREANMRPAIWNRGPILVFGFRRQMVMGPCCLPPFFIRLEVHNQVSWSCVKKTEMLLQFLRQCLVVPLPPVFLGRVPLLKLTTEQRVPKNSNLYTKPRRKSSRHGGMQQPEMCPRCSAGAQRLG